MSTDDCKKSEDVPGNQFAGSFPWRRLRHSFLEKMDFKLPLKVGWDFDKSLREREGQWWCIE